MWTRQRSLWLPLPYTFIRYLEKLIEIIQSFIKHSKNREYLCLHCMKYIIVKISKTFRLAEAYSFDVPFLLKEHFKALLNGLYFWQLSTTYLNNFTPFQREFLYFSSYSKCLPLTFCRQYWQVEVLWQNWEIGVWPNHQVLTLPEKCPWIFWSQRSRFPAKTEKCNITHVCFQPCFKVV